MRFNKGTIQIDKLRQQVEDAGTFDEQAREAGSVRPVVENHLSQTTQQAEMLAERAREEGERRNQSCVSDGKPFTIQSEHYHAVVLRLGAWVTILFDVAISALLATNWINLAGWQAALAGGLVASIFSLMSKAGLLTWVHDGEKPRPTRRRLQWISAISFALCFGFLAFILCMRNPAESWLETIIAMTGFSLGVLGVLMPLLAGALLALGYDFDWTYRYEKQYRALCHDAAETTGFLQWLDALRLRVPAPVTSLPTAWVIGLALCGSALAAQAPVLDVWVDDSRSIAATARANGVENLRRQLPALIRKHDLRQLRVGHFSHAPWQAPQVVFDLPQLTLPSCQPGEARGETRIFKQFEQQRRKQAEARCAAQRQQAQRDYDARLETVLAAVQRALLTSQQTEGACTALYDLFGRLANGSQARLAIIITDAVETCRKSAGGVAAPANGSQVMVLLVSDKNRPNGLDEFARKKQGLARLAPWAKVEPLFSERLCEVL
jgi:hypothetical protein